MRSFFAGIVVTVVGIALLAWVAAITGLIPANADTPPSAAERWFAQTALQATIHRLAPSGENPVAPTDANLIAGIRLYKQHCEVCHGGEAGKPTGIARGLYQHPPQLAKHGVEDDPAGETYWKVAHGIRLTGMPGFSKTLTQTQLWQITLFLQKMDHLTPPAQAVWHAV